MKRPLPIDPARRTVLALPLAALGSAGTGGLRLSATSRGTHLVSWPGGNLELNLVPMSAATQETSGVPVGYTHMREDQSLYLPVADLIGITGLQLEGSPRV